jgi:serine/threonine protein kinase
VQALIGQGGMGEVYKARDTRLRRDVALKVLPQSVAADADRLARFEREAQTLAALNHSHIAAIYGLEESDGTCALVMELVEGPTLADRIAQGPLPLDEALPVACQIAEALEAAHEAGIIHRDLKPANIKLRRHRQSAGLWSGKDDGTRRSSRHARQLTDRHFSRADDARRSDSRHSSIYVAGAGQGALRGSTHRHLGVWVCVVRNAHWTLSFRGNNDG